MYRQVLLREAAPSEVAFHVGTLARLTRVQAAANFLNSQEFRAGTGPRLTSFLLHALLFSRDPTTAEFSNVAEQVRTGTPVKTLITRFLQSTEFERILY